MEKIDNTVPHDPENGSWGDCHRVCYAMILGLSADEVPHFYAEGEGSGKIGRKRQLRFLEERGLRRLSIPVTPEQGDAGVRNFMGQYAPDTPYILSGHSRLGSNHSVVCLGSEFHHDPTGNGIIGPSDDGYYWVTTFTVGAP